MDWRNSTNGANLLHKSANLKSLFPPAQKRNPNALGSISNSNIFY